MIRSLRVCAPTVNGLGAVSLRVVEPICPLLYLHPPARADPESARRRGVAPHTALRAVDGGGGGGGGGGEMTTWRM